MRHRNGAEHVSEKHLAPEGGTLFLSDAHYGLQEMYAAISTRATENIALLIKLLKPHTIALNGDAFDAFYHPYMRWMHPKSATNAMTQTAPIRSVLQSYPCSIIACPGNCDPMQYEEEYALLCSALGLSKDNVRLTMTQLFHDPASKLIATHGHNIPQLTKTRIHTPHISTETFAMDPHTLPPLPEEVQHPSFFDRMKGRGISIASSIAKESGWIRARIQNRLAIQTGLLTHKVEESTKDRVNISVFSHTHEPMLERDETDPRRQRIIMNTGTATAQNRAPQATVGYVNALGTHASLFVVADKDSATKPYSVQEMSVDA